MYINPKPRPPRNRFKARRALFFFIYCIFFFGRPLVYLDGRKKKDAEEKTPRATGRIFLICPQIINIIYFPQKNPEKLKLDGEWSGRIDVLGERDANSLRFEDDHIF
jgi:hypothetical protein